MLFPLVEAVTFFIKKTHFQVIKHSRNLFWQIKH